MPRTQAVEELSVLTYDDDQVESLAKALSPNEVKYLCYLMARLNRAGAAERLAELVYVETPEDKNTMLALASMYIELKDKEKALTISKRLLDAYPNDDQALYFMAASYYLAGMFQEANALYRRLKTEFYQDDIYPYEIDLASSANQAGDWFRAMQSYQTLLREHDLNDQLRQPVRDALDQLYREHMDRFEVQPDLALQDNGWTLLSSGEFSWQVTDRARAGAFGEGQTTDLDAKDGIEPGNAVRGEAGAFTEITLSRMWSGSLMVGGSTGRGSRPLAEASITHQFDPMMSLKLGFDYQEATRDTLPIEYIDGRQNRVFLRFEDTWTNSWPVYAEFSARTVEVNDGVSLGEGLNAVWSIGKRMHLLDPELVISYVGYWQAFSRDSFNSSGVAPLVGPGTSLLQQQAIWDNLVSTNINNQGINLRIADHFWRAWSYEANAAVYYAFSRQAIEFAAGGRLRYFPRKSIELFTGLTYYSSTLTNNSGSYRLEWDSGLTVWF